MIKKIDNVILLGTSHVAKQSVDEIKEAIKMYKPEVVGIELDFNRFKSLMSKSKKNQERNFLKLLKEFGVSGTLFVLLGSYVQKSVGKSLGIDPGIDMKTAYLESRKNKITTALIDQDIRITVKKISSISFLKKMGMFFNLFKKSFDKKYQKKLQFDVKAGVPDEKFINNALELLGKEAPIMYKILIEDRNRYMVRKIMELRSKHDGVVMAVVGAGHLQGMEELLKLEVARTDLSMTFNIDVD